MSLFGDEMRLEFSPDEWALVDRPILGEGGAQGLLRRLMAGAGDRAIVADYRVLDRAYVYAYRYGAGGFQDRFRVIVRVALRAGWTPDGIVPRSTHSGGAFGREKVTP